jgi:benzoyl-CoA reductase/2-hydroxyglutaryl-CoA dehydratase subunit BcrC/BadD/HgdB
MEVKLSTITAGLARVEELYQSRDVRVKQLQKEGKKVIGYVCCYPPVELVTAAGIVPYRLTGSLQPITEADSYIETLVCPYVRSLFDLGIKGKFRFLDGMIWPHTCDAFHKSHDIWKYYMKPDFWHFLDVPHYLHPTSFEFFQFQIALLKEYLEDFAGAKISNKSLNDAIRLHNRNRALLRELSELRKADPPLISGTEMTQVMVAVMTIPVEEANDLVESVIEEVKDRRNHPERKSARLFLYG